MYKSAVVQRFFSFSLIITQIKGSGKPKRQPSQLNRRLNKKSLFYFKFQANLVLFQSSNFLERKTVSENCSARLPVQKVEHKIKIRSFLSKTCWVLIGGHAQCQVTQAIDGQKPPRSPVASVPSKRRRTEQRLALSGHASRIDSGSTDGQ